MIIKPIYSGKNNTTQPASPSGTSVRTIKPIYPENYQPSKATLQQIQKQKQNDIQVAQAKKVQPKQQSPIDGLISAVNSLDFDRIKTAFNSAVNATPGTLKIAGGVILGGMAQQQKAIDDFFTQKVPKPVQPIFNAAATTLAPAPMKPFVANRNLTRPLAQKAEEVGTKIRNEGQKERQKAVQPYAKLGGTNNQVQQVVEAVAFNLPQMAVSTGLTVGTALVTKNPALATLVGLSSSYGLGASEVYTQGRENGLTDRQALPFAMVGGALIGSLDFLPLNRLLRKTGAADQVQKSIVKKIANAIVSTGLQSGFEGITEGAQEIVGNAIEATYKENVDLFKNVGLSAVVGAILGGGADVTVSGTTAVANKLFNGRKTEDVINEVGEKIEKAFTTPAAKRTDEQKEIVNTLLSQEMTPREAGGLVLANNLENSPIGREIIQATIQAQQEGKNIKITGIDADGDVKVELIERNPVTVQDGVQATVQDTEGVILDESRPILDDNVDENESKSTSDGAIEISKPSITEQIRKPEKYKSDLEKKSFERLLADPEKLVDEYIAKFPRVANTDDAMEVFRDLGYAEDGHNSGDVTAAASQVSRFAFEKMLDTYLPEKEKGLLATMGGAGSGKSTATLNKFKNEFALTSDTTGARYKFFRENINNALEKGYSVTIMWVYRDPLNAWENGVLVRPRHVPVEAHINDHAAARDAFMEAVRDYADNPNVDFVALSNNGNIEDIKEISFDDVAKIQYDKDALRKQIYAVTEKHYQNKSKPQLTKARFDKIQSERQSKSNEGNAQGRTEKKNKDVLTTKNPQYDYQSTQLDLNGSVADKLRAFAKQIPENLLSKDPSDNYEAAQTGREMDPHVTVLYGLDNKLTEKQLRDVIKGTAPITLEFGETSIFDSNEKYDVLKVDIKSESLSALNKKMARILETPGQTFKEYRPHATIAYIKKGKAAEFANLKTFMGQKITINSLTFSTRDGKKVKIPLDGKLKTTQQVKIVEQKKKVSFTTKEARAIQSVFTQQIDKLRITAETQEELVNQGSRIVDTAINAASGDKTILAGIRTALNKEMFGFAGVSGNYKADYAMLKTLRNDPDNMLYKGASQAAKTKTSIDNFEVRGDIKETTEQFKIYKKIAQLTRKYAQSIGEGHLPRKTVGVFFPKTKNIRINSMNNLSTAAHEITHFIDDSLKMTSSIIDENSSTVTHLEGIYDEYYGGSLSAPKKTKVTEGIATLLQKYVEMPKTIEQKYPDLVKEILKPGGKHYHKVIGEILQDLNTIVGEYQGLSALDKIGARVTSEGTGIDTKSFLNFRQKVRTQIADKVFPVEILAEKGGVKGTAKDPSLWIRAYSAINGIVASNIITDNGYWSFTNLQDGWQQKHKFNWKTVINNLQKRKMTDSFAHYLVARREYFLYQELDEIKATLDDLNEITGEFNKLTEGTYKDLNRDMKAKLSEDYGVNIDELTFHKASKMINGLRNGAEQEYTSLKEVLEKDGMDRKTVDAAYNDNKDLFTEEEEMFDTLVREDLDLLHNKDVQLVDNDTYARLTAKKGYASFKRQFYDELVGESDRPASVRVGGTKVSSLIRRVGSERTIINPLFSALENHSEIARKAMKQVVYNQFGDLGSSALLPNLFQELQLKVAVESDTGKILYPQEKDPNIIMARKDYKRVPILTNSEVKTIIDTLLTYKNIDVFTQMYTGMSRLFTVGTTAMYPQFALTNFVVDQITATGNSYNKFKPLYSPLKQAFDIVTKKNKIEGKYLSEYLMMGGERQTFRGWQRLTPNDLFKRVSRERDLLDKFVNAGHTLADIASLPSAQSELLTRAAEYVNARKAGKSQIVALEEAGRVTAPFHHIGAWGAKAGSEFGQTFIRGLPFFNATLQVLDQANRVSGTTSGRVRMTFITIAVTAAYIAAISAMMKATDEQKEQYKDLEAEELAKFIYFPNPFDNNLLRARMPENYTMVGAVINMVIANQVFGTEYKAKDYIDAATAWIPDQFNPTDPSKAILGWIPQLFKPVTHVIYNVKEYPTVGPIVGQGLENRPEKLQYNESTSEFAKKVGEIFNISPLKVDYLITGYFGRASGFITGKPNIYNPATSIVRDHYFTTGKRVREFYDIKEKNDGIYNAYQNNEGQFANLSKSEVREVYRKKIISNNITELLGEYRDLDIKTEQEKAAKLRAKIIVNIEALNNGTIPNNINKWSLEAQQRRLKKIRENNN